LISAGGGSKGWLPGQVGLDSYIDPNSMTIGSIHDFSQLDAIDAAAS